MSGQPQSDRTARPLSEQIDDAVAVLNDMYAVGLLRGLYLPQIESILRSPEYAPHLEHYLFERLVVLEEILELAIDDFELAQICERYADAVKWPELKSRVWKGMLNADEMSIDRARPLVDAHALVAGERECEAVFMLAIHWALPLESGAGPWQSEGSVNTWARTETLLVFNKLQQRKPLARDASARLVAAWWPVLGLIEPDASPSVKQMTEALQLYDLLEPMEGTSNGMPHRLWACGLIAGVFCDSGEPARALAVLMASIGHEELLPGYPLLEASIIGKAHKEISRLANATDSLEVVQERAWRESMYLINQVWCAALTANYDMLPNMAFKFLCQWFLLEEADFGKSPEHLMSCLATGNSRPLFLNEKTRRHLITQIATAASLANRPQFAVMAFAALAKYEARDRDDSNAATTARLPDCPPEFFNFVDQALRGGLLLNEGGSSMDFPPLTDSTIAAARQFLADWSPILTA